MIHNNEVIAIEEDLLNYRAMIRQFTFHNRSNNLKIAVLTLGATIVSCKLEDGTQECVVNVNQTNFNDLTNISLASSRPNWISHVRGLDTLSLTTNSGSGQSQSIVYQLTFDNQLIINGKLKNQHQLLYPHYFNLNLTNDKPTLDGHVLQIKSSDPSALIQRIVGQNDTDELRFDLAGDEPCAITDEDFDIVYGLTCNNDASLITTLQFGTRTVRFTLNSQIQNDTNSYQCKIRIRSTNGGISMMPTTMNEFKCVYKFTW